MLKTLNNLLEAEKDLYKSIPIGTIVEHRADGSIIYMSSKGIVNCDNWKDLEEVRREDATICSTQ